MQKNGILGAKTYINPTSYTLSYTLSYTRKCLQIQDVGGMGVGNVGFYSKTFFRREEERFVPEITKGHSVWGTQ